MELIMSSRIGPFSSSEPPPEEDQSELDAFSKKLKEDIGDKEEQQPKKQSFDLFEKKKPTAPSPFELTAKPSSLSGFSSILGFSELETIPTPDTTPTPFPAKESALAGEDLPKSESFWEEILLPTDPPPAPEFQEHLSIQAEERPDRSRKTTSENSLPYEMPPLQRQASFEPGIETGISKTGKTKARSSEPVQEIGSSQEIDSSPKRPWASQAKQTEHHEGKPKRQSNREQPPLPIVLPSPMPMFAMEAVHTAKEAAKPYLNPKITEIAQLFDTMVGTIAFIAADPSGISSTEITLNSPAFEQSVFYNSKVIIDQYASAPNSLNIRLTGNPAAVTMFLQNQQALEDSFAAAYEAGSISFQIGRLEAFHALAEDHDRSRKDRERDEDEE